MELLKVRKKLIKVCKKNNFRSIFPEPKLCGDNAAMIALVGLEKYKIKKFDIQIKKIENFWNKKETLPLVQENSNKST